MHLRLALVHFAQMHVLLVWGLVRGSGKMCQTDSLRGVCRSMQTTPSGRGDPFFGIGHRTHHRYPANSNAPGENNACARMDTIAHRLIMFRECEGTVLPCPHFFKGRCPYKDPQKMTWEIFAATRSTGFTIHLSNPVRDTTSLPQYAASLTDTNLLSRGRETR